MSKKKPISSDDLDTLLSSIAADIVTVSFHWRLWNDLWSTVPEFSRELNQSPAFWMLTFNAHRDAALFRLGRLFDQTKGALSLKTLVEIVRRNAHLFDEPHFRERLKGNEFVDSLAQTARRPDVIALSEDAKVVSAKTDPVVASLVQLRNQVLAHKDQRVVLGTLRSPAEQLSNEEIGQLVKRAISISNRYSSLFKASTDSDRIVGHDDHLNVLKSIRRDLEASERAIEAELALTQEGLRRTEVF